MPSARTLLVSLLPAFALLAACKEEPSVHDRVSDYAEQINQQIAIYCDCWNAMGYATFADCTADHGYLGPSQQACVEDALERDEAAAGSWLECVVDLEQNYTECVDARLVCQDPSSDDACVADYDIGYDGCIQLPENVLRGLEDCTPSSGGGGGGPVCDYDWTGSENQNNCPAEWNGDGGCDCGCQFDDVDC